VTDKKHSICNETQLFKKKIKPLIFATFPSATALPVTSNVMNRQQVEEEGGEKKKEKSGKEGGGGKG